MIRRIAAMLMAMGFLMGGILVGTAQAGCDFKVNPASCHRPSSTTVDPCPGDRARARNSYEHYVAAYNAGDQAGAAYWRDRYTQDWNVGHAHHCW